MGREKGEVKKSVAKPGIVDPDKRFIALSNGTVKDTITGLMWAREDNGTKIDWHAAKAYCRNFRGGGFADWRLPTLAELETLFDSKTKNTKPPTEGCSGGYFINRLFHITCCCLWAAEDGGERPAAFPFNMTERLWHHQTAQTGQRVLPVRKD